MLYPIEKSNFSNSELAEFFRYLKGDWLYAITRHGNIEFVSCGDATIYRLCYNKETGKYYFAYTRNGRSGTMFHCKEKIFGVRKPIRCKLLDMWGEFQPDPQYKTVSRPQTFNTIWDAACRFNKYFDRKQNMQ